jgi:hypothetical protein
LLALSAAQAVAHSGDPTPSVAVAQLAGTHAMLATFGTAPPGATTFLKLVNWVKWIAGSLAGVSMIVVAVILMVQHHAPGTSHAGRLLKVFSGMMLLSSASAIAAVLVH